MAGHFFFFFAALLISRRATPFAFGLGLSAAFFWSLMRNSLCVRFARAFTFWFWNPLGFPCVQLLSQVRDLALAAKTVF